MNVEWRGMVKKRRTTAAVTMGVKHPFIMLYKAWFKHRTNPPPFFFIIFLLVLFFINFYAADLFTYIFFASPVSLIFIFMRTFVFLCLAKYSKVSTVTEILYDRAFLFYLNILWPLFVCLNVNKQRLNKVGWECRRSTEKIIRIKFIDFYWNYWK